MIIEFLGYTGGFLLATCTIPQIVRMFRTKEVESLSVLTYIMWFFGELIMLTYTLIVAPELPLIANFSFGLLIAIITIILYYKYKK